MVLSSSSFAASACVYVCLCTCTAHAQLYMGSVLLCFIPNDLFHLNWTLCFVCLDVLITKCCQSFSRQLSMFFNYGISITISIWYFHNIFVFCFSTYYCVDLCMRGNLKKQPLGIISSHTILSRIWYIAINFDRKRNFWVNALLYKSPRTEQMGGGGEREIRKEGRWEGRKGGKKWLFPVLYHWMFLTLAAAVIKTGCINSLEFAV